MPSKSKGKTSGKNAVRKRKTRARRETDPRPFRSKRKAKDKKVARKEAQVRQKADRKGSAQKATARQKEAETVRRKQELTDVISQLLEFDPQLSEQETREVVENQPLRVLERTALSRMSWLRLLTRRLETLSIEMTDNEIREMLEVESRHGFKRDGWEFRGVILLAEAEDGSHKTFLEDALNVLAGTTYRGVEAALEVVQYGVHLGVLREALETPEDAIAVARLNQISPGVIYCYPPTRDMVIQKTIDACSALDRNVVEEAINWLKIVCTPVRSDTGIVSLGFRHLVFFPELYAEVAFLREIARMLRDRSLKPSRIHSVIHQQFHLPKQNLDKWLPAITLFRSKPVAGLNDDKLVVVSGWLLSRFLSGGREANAAREYREHTIRNTLSMLCPDWRERRRMILVAAKEAARKWLAEHPAV